MAWWLTDILLASCRMPSGSSDNKSLKLWLLSHMLMLTDLNVIVEVVIRHNFHSYFLSIFDPTSLTFLTHPFPLMLIFLIFFLFYVSSHSQTDNKNVIQLVWYRSTNSWHWLLDHQMIYLAIDPWNNPIPLWPLDPALELQPPSTVPIVQSSRLPGHGAQVGVCPPHKDLGWLQGSSSVPQQDLPDCLPPQQTVSSDLVRDMSNPTIRKTTT